MIDPMEKLGITVFGCEADEAEAFFRLSPGFGVQPTVVADAVSEANAGLAAGNFCVSVNHKSGLSAPMLRALKDAGVRYVSTRSIGCNHIDTRAAERLGVAVGTVAYSPDSVADYTLMLMLMLARRTKATLRAVDQRDYRLERLRGRELRDMTVGVLGAGHIGNEVIRRLRGFGCRVLVHDHGQQERAGFVSLEALLGGSDIVTLHVPLTADTRHIIGPKQLALMRPGAFLINTGRGGLVDTGALTEALEQGTLGGAALDVLEGEEEIFYADCRETPIRHPYLPRLQKLPNVIITPHTAFYTQRALQDTVENTLLNCLEFERSLHHA